MTRHGVIHNAKALVSAYAISTDQDKIVLSQALAAMLDIVERMDKEIAEWVAAYEVHDDVATSDFLKPEVKAAVRRMVAAEEGLFKLAHEAKGETDGQADEDA